MAAMQLGVLVRLEEGPEQAIAKAQSMGFPTCQVVCWNAALLNSEYAQRLRAAAEKDEVTITTIWVGLPGRHVWDFLQGPVTIGLVPPERLCISQYRAGQIVAPVVDFVAGLVAGHVRPHCLHDTHRLIARAQWERSPVEFASNDRKFSADTDARIEGPDL